MNAIQKKIVESYAVLVMAERIKIDAVPKYKKIGSVDFPIYSEVEIKIANRTIEILG